MAERLKPLDTSLSGPDGSGKDTAVLGVLDLLFQTFEEDLRIVRLDRPPMYIWQDKDGNRMTRKLFVPFFRFINHVHKVGDRDANIRLVQAANTANVMMQGWVVRRISNDSFKPDLYLSGRNYFTDPTAYAQFYAPELTALTIEERLRFMKQISRLPDYDQIYFMQIDPLTAYKRIEGRIAEERVKPTGQPLWQHRHETVQGLTLLSEAFQEIPLVVEKVFPNTEVINIDASAPKGEVALRIASDIRRRLNPIIYNTKSESIARELV